MKKTAVEWLEEHWNKYDLNLGKAGFKFKIKQAKEMEKEQLKEMYLKGIKNYDPTFKSE